MASSGQTPGDGAPAIDRTTLESLEAVLGSDKLRDFVGEYLEEAARLEQSIRDAWKAGDWDGVYRAAHNLVSSAGNFGALQVSALADSLQQAARRREEAALTTALALLGEASGLASAELRRMFGIA